LSLVLTAAYLVLYHQHLLTNLHCIALPCCMCTADQLGVLPGAEFRAAARAAEAAGASLVLGDRPIEITLERAWNALPWQRRFKLLGDLMLASFAPQAEVGGELTGGWLTTHPTAEKNGHYSRVGGAIVTSTAVLCLPSAPQENVL
jgi:pheromone shutdown protein TraB